MPYPKENKEFRLINLINLNWTQRKALQTSVSNKMKSNKGKPTTQNARLYHPRIRIFKMRVPSFESPSSSSSHLASE